MPIKPRNPNNVRSEELNASHKDHTHDHGTLTGLGDDDHPQYLQNVVEDTTPQLGGDLDGQSSFDLANIVNAEFEGFIDFEVIADPTDPSATQLRLWAQDFAGFNQLHFKDSTGLDYLLGRDNIETVRNTTGATITKGSWVYISGSTGVVPNVALAEATSPATPAMGIAVADIANNVNGQIMTLGDAQNLDTSAFVAGDILYLSPTTPGAVQTTTPGGTNSRQRVGVVIRSHASLGVIAVLIGTEFDPTDTATFTNKTIDTANNDITIVEADISDLAHTTDHGALGGLLDDDHTQYFLADGTRPMAGLFNVGSPTELTISSGEITVTQSYHTVDTQGDASTDDLHLISGGSEGDILFIRTVASARDVVVKHNTNNIILLNDVDFTLSHPDFFILQLIKVGTNWLEVGRRDQ